MTEESAQGFPVAKSVWGKLVVILAVLVVVAGLGILSSSDRENRLKRDAEVIALMGGYSMDTVSIYDGSWSGNDGSIPGRYTLHITKGGAIHVCRQVRVESLRNSEPVKCDDGAVIKPKVVPAAGN